MGGTGRIMFVNERLNILVGQLPVEATYKVRSPSPPSTPHLVRICQRHCMHIAAWV